MTPEQQRRMRAAMAAVAARSTNLGASESGLAKLSEHDRRLLELAVQTCAKAFGPVLREIVNEFEDEIDALRYEVAELRHRRVA
jgi:hypothetical protein